MAECEEGLKKVFESWRENGGVRTTGKQSLTWLQARIQDPVPYALTSLKRDAADSNASRIPLGQIVSSLFCCFLDFVFVIFFCSLV